MALTITKDGNAVTVTFDNTTPFDLCSYLGVSSPKVNMIAYNPAVAGETLTLRLWNATGPPLNLVSVSGGTGVVYPRSRLRPYVVGNEAPDGSQLIFILG